MYNYQYTYKIYIKYITINLTNLGSKILEHKTGVNFKLSKLEISIDLKVASSVVSDWTQDVVCYWRRSVPPSSNNLMTNPCWDGTSNSWPSDGPPLRSIFSHTRYSPVQIQSNLLPVYNSLMSTDLQQRITPSNTSTIVSYIDWRHKVIEKAVLKRLIDHCELHNLLLEDQLRFIKGSSTTSTLIKLVKFIIDVLEKRNMVAGIMLDFNKAFDCLGHNLILSKLDQLGFKGQTKAWFKS